MKRSYEKIITKEVKVLKFMRESRGLSMRRAALFIGVSSSCINLIENGRMDLPKCLISRILKAYKYTEEDFQMYINDQIDMPINKLSECIHIIKKLNEKQLNAILVILQSYDS